MFHEHCTNFYTLSCIVVRSFTCAMQASIIKSYTDQAIALRQALETKLGAKLGTKMEAAPFKVKAPGGFMQPHDLKLVAHILEYAYPHLHLVQVDRDGHWVEFEMLNFHRNHFDDVPALWHDGLGEKVAKNLT